MNHTDIVIRERTSMDPSSAESILACLVRVVKALPPEEHGGLLRKDAGENILFYPPTNCNVSISRVCYPNGQLVKIFSDAGPNGSNGPAWNDDGMVEPSRYLDIVGEAPIPDPPVPPVPPSPPIPTVDLTPILDQLHALSVQVASQHLAQARSFEALQMQLDQIQATQTQRYQGSARWIGKVTLEPQE